MSNLNRIILVGTVTEKPDTKFGLENSSTLSKFVLAVNRPQRQDGTNETDFIPIVCWGKLGDYVAENIQPKNIVVVEGRIQNRSVDNAGQRTWFTEVNASSLKLISGAAKEESLAPAAKPGVAVGQNPFDAVTEDDVPF